MKLVSQALKGLFLHNLMENKNVGYLILGISLIIILVIFLFNSALKEIINSNCTMQGHESCTMYDTLTKQTYLSLGIVGILILVGLVLVFTKPKEKIIIKKIKEKQEQKSYDLTDLRKEEKQIFNTIKENKTIFQADLIEKSGFGKAKISRILDRLENKDLIERKRRGMTNVVVMKEN